MTDTTERLMAALRAEHAAIFGYGALGPRLDGGTVEAARAAEAAHRARRDALVLRLTSAGATPPPSAPTYALPFAVTDRASALRLAVTIEERTATIWRLVLPRTTGDERKTALDALTDCAVRAVGFRQASNVTPATVPFPGRSAT